MTQTSLLRKGKLLVTLSGKIMKIALKQEVYQAYNGRMENQELRLENSKYENNYFKSNHVQIMYKSLQITTGKRKSKKNL